MENNQPNSKGYFVTAPKPDSKISFIITSIKQKIYPDKSSCLPAYQK
jgi:hypothetical protein